jgi:ABC-2 type transport system permease protein
LSAFAVNVFQLLLYGAGGLLLSNVTIANANVVGCMVILLLSLVIVAAIGLLAAAVQIAIQKGSAVVWVLGSGLWFLTGALFPVSTLPKPLQILSTSLPLTHLLIGLRLALLQGAGLLQLRSEIVILAAFSALLLPLALFVFSVTLRRARRQGTLSFY